MMKAIKAVLLLISISSVAHAQSSVNDLCECVPYFQCNYNGQANEAGEGIIDIRTGVVDEDDNPLAGRRQCPHYLEVCCLPPERKPGNDADQPPNQGGQNNPPNQGGQVTPPNQGSNTGGSNSGIKGPHVERGCGYRNPNGVGFRITGNFNNEANFGEYPWTVAIMKDTVVQGNNVKVFQCGGSLIHKRVVLTAAHCVQDNDASKFTIRAGEWDTQTTNEPLPHQDRQVAIINIHPQYRKNILFNDFALLILVHPVELADNVETVCLPDATETFDYSRCFATGWGKDQFGGKGRYQVILKSVEVPVVPRDTCQEALRKTRLGQYFKLDQSFLCAGGENGVDTCTGDGGSPLVCPLAQDPSRYAQAGIVSWGIGCGTNGVPGVYADVAKAREWIDNTLAGSRINISSYIPESNNGFSSNRINSNPSHPQIGSRIGSSIVFSS